MTRLMLVMAVVGLAGCEQRIDAGGSCTPSTCAGCCQNDKCELGNTASACGQGGLACDVCVSAQVCSTTNQCVAGGAGGGGGSGGGSGGAGGAGGAAGGAGGAGGGAPSKKKIFVTSSTFMGDLRPFGVGTGITDVLAIADSLCMTAAQSANLAGNFKAFLSTTTVGAIDRITEAGPWHNMQGTVVFNNKAGMLVKPLAGMTFDETGKDLTLTLPAGSWLTWTGSGTNGRYAIANCANWTNDTPFDRSPTGWPEAGDSTWMASAPSNCNTQHRLYCFEQAPSACVPETDVAFCQRLQKTCGAVTAADNCGSTRTATSCGTCASPLFCASATSTCAAPPGKRVFVTKQTYTGDLATAGGAASGVAGGDKLCANSAAANGLGGVWKAWLSDSFQDAIDHVTGTGPWYRLDGAMAFPNHASLGTQPMVPINIDEYGATITTVALPQQSVWTGTGAGGRRPLPTTTYKGENTCVDFVLTSQGGVIFGITGWVHHSNANWSDNDWSNCVTSNHLYCFEQ